MKQEIACQKILAELLTVLMDLKIIKEKDEEVLEEVTWVAFTRVYATGYDEGRLQYHKRKSIGRYSLEDQLLQIYDSSQAAARHLNIPEYGISKAATGKTQSSGGFKWKYILEKSLNASEETVGQPKSKSVQPKSKTRSSKKD